METSPTIAKLAAALAAFQKDVKPIKKDGTNPHFRSKYATLDAIMDTVRPVLSKHELAIVQSQNATRLLHTSGEWIQVTVDLAPANGKPQEYGSAMTYARRYGVSAILGLATEEDDDGNAAQAAPQATRKPAAAPSGKIGDNAKLRDEVMNLAATAGYTKLDMDALAKSAKVASLWDLPESRAAGLMKHIRENPKTPQPDVNTPAVDDIFGGQQ